MWIRLKRAGFVILGLLLSVIISLHTAEAIDITQGLQISPVSYELNVDPGKTYTLPLSLLNVTTGDIVFKSFVNDFDAADETGTPNVILTGTGPKSSSLASWITVPHNILIGAKKTKTVNIELHVPSNAEPGGHYGLVRFNTTVPHIDSTGVAVTASTGPLILVRVSGKITESLYFKQFFTAQNEHQRGFFEAGPIDFVERIANNGNVHVKPQGDLVVTNMFGHQVAKLVVNDQKGNILPSSIRRFNQILRNHWMFGSYHATTQLAYGSKGEVLSGSLTFWVIPYRLIFLCLIFLLILIWGIRRLIKRYNQKIIERAMRNRH